MFLKLLLRLCECYFVLNVSLRVSNFCQWMFERFLGSLVFLKWDWIIQRVVNQSNDCTLKGTLNRLEILLYWHSYTQPPHYETTLIWYRDLPLCYIHLVMPWHTSENITITLYLNVFLLELLKTLTRWTNHI